MPLVVGIFSTAEIKLYKLINPISLYFFIQADRVTVEYELEYQLKVLERIR